MQVSRRVGGAERQSPLGRVAFLQQLCGRTLGFQGISRCIPVSALGFCMSFCPLKMRKDPRRRPLVPFCFSLNLLMACSAFSWRERLRWPQCSHLIAIKVEKQGNFKESLQLNLKQMYYSNEDKRNSICRAGIFSSGRDEARLLGRMVLWEGSTWEDVRWVPIWDGQLQVMSVSDGPLMPVDLHAIYLC